MIRLLDYFFILRPILFFPGWTTTLAGYLCATGGGYPWTMWSGKAPSGLILVGIASAMLMGAGFIVNQWYDTDSDRLNNKLFFLAQDFVSKKAAIAEAMFLMLGALILASRVSVLMLVIFMVAALLFTVVYNMKPLALKDRVFGSFVANALMGFLAFAYGWFVMSDSWTRLLTSGVPYLFFNTSLYFLTTIPDASGDRDTQKQTICVVYGMPTTIRWGLAFEVAALISGAMLADPVILVPTIVVLPLFLYLLFHPVRHVVIRTIKLGLFSFAISVAVYFPAFIILIVFFFFFTRWYYRRRFHITYPNFGGE